MARHKAEGVLFSYSKAVYRENKTWTIRIKIEEGYIHENYTVKLIKRKANMNVNFCRLVFRIKNDTADNHHIFCRNLSTSTRARISWYLCCSAILCSSAFICWHFKLSQTCFDHTDLVTAFLKEDLRKDTYMNVWGGICAFKKPKYDFKLLKALDWLEEAPNHGTPRIINFILVKTRISTS